MSDELPFTRYSLGGRVSLGRPKERDGTARHGYGPPVFKECGNACVLDEGRVPGVERHITNLVTCCRACNDFGNRYTVAAPRPTSEAAFYDLCDAVFAERKAAILAKRDAERAIFAKLPAAGLDRAPPPGEDA